MRPSKWFTSGNGHDGIRRQGARGHAPATIVKRASLSGLDQLIMASSNALFFLLLTRQASPENLARLAPAFLVTTLAVAFTRALAGEPQLLQSYSMPLAQARASALFYGLTAAALLAPILGISKASFDRAFWISQSLLIVGATLFESERYLALLEGRYSRLLLAESTWAAALVLPGFVSSYGDTDRGLLLYAIGAFAAYLVLATCPRRVAPDSSRVEWRRLVPLLGSMGGALMLLHAPLLVVALVVGQDELASLRLLQAALNPFVTIAGLFGFIALATRTEPGLAHIVLQWLATSSGLAILLFGPSTLLERLLGDGGADLIAENRGPAAFYFTAAILLALLAFPLRQIGTDALRQLRAQNRTFFAGGIVGVVLVVTIPDLTLTRFFFVYGCVLVLEAAMSLLLVASITRTRRADEDRHVNVERWS